MKYHPSDRPRKIAEIYVHYNVINTFRQYGDYEGSDLDVVESILQEKVDNLKNESESVEESQENLRETMGLASTEAERAVEGEESKDVVRLNARSPEAQKRAELRRKLSL